MIAKLPKNPTDSQITNQTGNIRPEAELLLTCVRYQFQTATSAEVETLLQTELDWDYFIQKAVDHHVFLLVYQTLKKTHPELIAASVLQNLQIQAQQKIARNVIVTQELFRVLDVLAANQIDAVPFKGPTWATLGYGNMALREFGDLDILIRPKDYATTKAVLREQGYHELYSKEPKNGQFTMLRDDGKVRLDLHLGLVSQRFYLPIDSESFFDDLQTLSISGRTVSTFSPINSLALGYIHGTKDNWGTLKRICDFAALTRKYSTIDFQDMLARCGSDYTDRNFWLGIIMIQTYLKISFSETIIEKSQQFPEISEIVQQHQQLFYQTELGNCSLFGSLYVFPMMNMSLWGKLRYLGGIVFNVNAADLQTYDLPRFLFFLYYPLRIIRLIKTYKFGPEKLAFLWNLLRR